MSGLIGGLINGAKALIAHQAGVQTAGRNLANVNNPEYARQRVLLGDLAVIDTSLGPAGSGVELLGIAQVRDQFLDAAVIREIANTATLLAQQSALEKAQANLGEQIDSSSDAGFIGDASHSTNGISAALNDFFNAFEDLATRPTDAGARQSLLERVEVLVSKFNVSDQRLSTLQSDLTAQIDTDLTSADTLLKDIAGLNAAIAQTEVSLPGSAVDLRDQRQARLEELAKYIDFTSRPIPGSAGQIEIVAKDASGSDVLLLEKTRIAGGLTFDGTQFLGGAPASPLALTGGALHGNLVARDGAIQQLRDDLARTATQLARAVNTAYNPTGATGDFFQVPPGAGLIATDPSLNFNTLKTSDTGNAGANELALAVGDVARRAFSVAGGDLIDGTIGSFHARVVASLGETISGVNTRFGDQQIVEQMISTQRDSVSGVSMDEEMTELMKFQRAFQASARVVRTLDEMLSVVVSDLKR